MLLSPPVDVGGVPPWPVPRLPSGGMVLSWCYRGTGVLLACYRSGTGMARQERSLIALSMPEAKHQRGRSLTVGPAIGFGAEIFFNRAILASRRYPPLKMRNFVGILLNFRVSSRFVPIRA